jgi:branched-chain amino acid transport system ATP-binding protein
LLRIENISFSYGPVRALDGVSLEVAAGELVCLLGSNGAGKTTLLEVISGLHKPRHGTINLDGQLISGMKPSRVVQAGVVQVPEGRQLFAPMSVEENLELGAFCRRQRGEKDEIARDMKRMFDMFPILYDRRKQAAGTMSGGEQQMAAIARALMARPKVLLLDEPSLGLSPLLTREIFQTIKSLPETGTSVLLVEQNALGALGISQRGYIITNGQMRFSGATEDILHDERLREAFLGPERRLEED